MMDRVVDTFSRRCFVGCTALLLPGLITAQDSDLRSPAFRLAHEFKNGVLLAVSPDGSRLCLHFFKAPFDSFLYEMGRWFHTGPEGDFLQVVDIGDWTPLYSGQFRAQVWPASFFADGGSLYAETWSYAINRHLMRQEAIVDLSDGQRSERSQQVDVGIVLGRYALGPGRLLQVEYGTPVRNRTGDLVVQELPDYREIVRVPYATREREPFGPTIGNLGVESDLFFSADRRILFYAFDHTLVCRRTSDLKVLWTRQFEAVYKEARFVAVSPDGSTVAAGISALSDKEKKTYVGIYSAEDGREVTRLPISGAEGLGLSADGRLVAVADRTVWSDPTVHVYEVSSGRRIASILHDHIVDRKTLFLTGGINGIVFTSDGKYLITSGALSTKVWAISGA